MQCKCPLCGKDYNNRDSRLMHLLGFHKVEAVHTSNIIYTD